MFKLFMCAVCQVEVKPGEGVSIHAGTANCGKLRPWDGPFLCASCQEKKDAMEGKRGYLLTSYLSFEFVDLLRKLILVNHYGNVLQIDIVVTSESY